MGLMHSVATESVQTHTHTHLHYALQGAALIFKTLAISSYGERLLLSPCSCSHYTHTHTHTPLTCTTSAAH